jgi:hypothetical protein
VKLIAIRNYIQLVLTLGHVGLEINAKKTKYMIISRHPNSGQKHVANESFQNVAKLKYFGTILTNQDDIHDEIKSRLNLGNVCCYSVQNMTSRRTSKK